MYLLQAHVGIFMHTVPRYHGLLPPESRDCIPCCIPIVVPFAGTIVLLVQYRGLTDWACAGVFNKGDPAGAPSDALIS